MKFFAHSPPDPLNLGHGTPEWVAAAEPLGVHLRAVAHRARGLAEGATAPGSALAATAEAAGLLHDLGKYRPEWQAYLSGRGPQTPHAVHGAAYALKPLRHPAIAAAVYGHHAGLPDWDDLKERATAARPATEAAERGAAADSFRLPEPLPAPFPLPDGAARRRFEFWTRVLFSVLVDADRLETERFYAGPRPGGPRLDPDGLLARLDEERGRKANQAAERGTRPDLLDLRNRIYDGCVAAGGEGRGFFELTVPTGGGKTLAGMAFALAHARRHDLRRVIVVIPYLSIIEQNAREYARVLGPGNVLEHHSAVGEQEPEKAAGEPPRRTAAELATENWDAPVVVTTSVQFLETLLEASPRRCRKLHNVARSVVLFDEAQSLPTPILNPLVSAFRELVGTFGCSVVFGTATQPAFRRGPGLTEGLAAGELKPILPADLVAESFEKLQRVEYRPDLAAPWDWDTLVGRLTGGGQTQGLCVLNTRRHAREVWEKLRAAVPDPDAVVHLSSAMCAAHRLAVLGDPDNPAHGSVRHRLRAGLPCWLVSTQVIEAGVDVDFPRVFRALGPLDAIVQAAGRCNREGKSARGEVVIFQPADEGMPRGLYQTATGKARTFLGEVTGELATDPAVFARYFDELYGVAGCDAHGIQAERAGFNFRTVAEKARVIDDGGTPVVVSYGPSPGLIADCRSRGTFDRAALRGLQRYTVNLRQNDRDELERRAMIGPLLTSCPDGPSVLHPAAYHDRLGVVVADRPPDDFII